MPRSFVEIPVAQPLAGNDFSYQISSGDKMQLITLRAIFTAAVAVANRYVHFQIVNLSGQILHEIVAPVVTASSAVTYSAVSGTGFYNTSLTVEDGVLSIPIPNLTFPVGCSVRSKTTAIAAADQWSGIYMTALVGNEQEHLKWLETVANGIANLDLAQ
jgi:hypothetical protein